MVETTSGAVAYTISTTEGLVKFDPEMPSAGYEVVASFDKLNVAEPWLAWMWTRRTDMSIT